MVTWFIISASSAVEDLRLKPPTKLTKPAIETNRVTEIARLRSKALDCH